MTEVDKNNSEQGRRHQHAVESKLNRRSGPVPAPDTDVVVAGMLQEFKKMMSDQQKESMEALKKQQEASQKKQKELEEKVSQLMLKFKPN